MVNVAVPHLDDYRRAPHGGISRVLGELTRHWPECQLSDAAVVSPRLPVLRNVQGRLRLASDADVVLLPQMTGSYLLKDVRAPSVAIVHDVGIADCPEDRRDMDWLTQASVRRSLYGLRYASRIAAVSEFTARRLATYVPEVAKKTVVIPPGVGDVFRTVGGTARQEARQHIESVTGRYLGQPLLLYVGTERSRKNVPLLLQVVARLKKGHPAAQLLKVGGAGGDRHRAGTVRWMNRLGLTGNDIVFVPALDDRDLALAYRAADVYVSASLYEGFCLPVAEALVVGTPVVAVAAGAVPEVTGSLGILVHPDAGVFTNAVLDACRHARLDDAEQERFATRHTWTRTAHRYADVMQELLG